MAHSTLVPFTLENPHTVYIYNLDIEFDEIWCLDFLEHYECLIDLMLKELKTIFKMISLHKLGKKITNHFNNLNTHDTDDNYTSTQVNIDFSNKICIEARSERISKLYCNFCSTDGIKFM